MKKLFHNTVIIGTGCAGYACAYQLDKLGVEDTVIICENKNFGTSRNTGSDKQTYYKLSLSGKDDDSVYKMAEELYNFGGINGDTALCEAAGSAECFYNLIFLGVPFPKNEFGEYVGYKTDHDSCKRATSAGPLTSKYMTVALEKEVKKRNIKVIENLCPVKIIKENNKAVGCVFVDNNNEFVFVFCNNLVFATGGQACLYKESVFPQSQFGAMGVLIDADVEISNFNYWQFGIASTKFRWNLSGSYQQVIPKYVSEDEHGNKTEFLRNSLSDKELFELTFFKGYEWPFDSRKRNKSTLIDILVQNELSKGNKVYLDYTTNPTNFDFDLLTDTAYEYLKNSNALKQTPIERLKALNIKAFELYKDNNIDLSKDLLQIGVCAQHQNGGVSVDEWYETNVKNLYVIGEASGVFGAYRPGGTALNSTQVGALRCAEKIALTKNINESIDIDCDKLITEFQNFTIKIDAKLFTKWQKNNSIFCGAIRDIEKLKLKLIELENDISICKDFKTFNMLKSAVVLYKSSIFAGENIGSYGSSIYKNNSNIIPENDENKNKIVVYSKGECYLKEPKPIPESPQWFESVWASYTEKRGI